MSGIKKKSKIHIEGDILKVPFVEGYHTYARALHYSDYAFYDCKTANTENKSAEEVIQSKIIFTAHVNDNAFGKDGWEVIGNLPLENNLERFAARYFIPAATNETNITFYKMHKQEIQQAIEKDWIGDGRMQMGGIYDPSHIRERLQSYYENGRYVGNQVYMNAFYRDCKLMGIEL